MLIGFVSLISWSNWRGKSLFGVANFELSWSVLTKVAAKSTYFRQVAINIKNVSIGSMELIAGVQIISVVQGTLIK